MLDGEDEEDEAKGGSSRSSSRCTTPRNEFDSDNEGDEGDTKERDLGDGEQRGQQLAAPRDAAAAAADCGIVEPHRLELLGFACLCIATKIEETPPEHSVASQAPGWPALRRDRRRPLGEDRPPPPGSTD